jgi:DNA-binding MarR family transcriptional regulator
MAGEPTVAELRRFNRTVTQRIGALSDRYLARSRSLGASRVLWEIGAEGCEVRALRSRLGLDSGQLSRLLRGLEREGLVEIDPSVADRRVRVARLTPAGAHERALLDERSDALARSILDPLDHRQRAELLSAVRVVERLITTSLVDLRIADPAGADARRCLRAYFAELTRRSGSRFDPATSISLAPDELRPPAGAFRIAYVSEDPVGCGAVRHHPGGASDVKRMWVAERARGLGLGRRVLAALEALAREHGARVTRLETNDALVEAIALYRSSGYREVAAFNDEPFADRWFQKML